MQNNHYIPTFATNKNSRFLAVSFFTIFALAIYWLFFHWFVLQSMENEEQLEGLMREKLRLTRTIASRPHVAEQLRISLTRRTDNPNFLQQSTPSLAVADLQNRIKQSVLQLQTEDKQCNVISQRKLNYRHDGPFAKIAVSSTLSCDLEIIQRLIYALETQHPRLIVHNIDIQKSRRRMAQPSNVLQARIDVQGYLASADTDSEQ
ncbi:MAG: type II secretion system protein GspM [Aestuariibacter sp.]